MLGFPHLEGTHRGAQESEIETWLVRGIAIARSALGWCISIGRHLRTSLPLSILRLLTLAISLLLLLLLLLE